MYIDDKMGIWCNFHRLGVQKRPLSNSKVNTVSYHQFNHKKASNALGQECQTTLDLGLDMDHRCFSQARFLEPAAAAVDLGLGPVAVLEAAVYLGQA